MAAMRDRNAGRIKFKGGEEEEEGGGVRVLGF